MHLPTICLVILCSLANGKLLFEADITCNIPGAHWCGEIYVLEKNLIKDDKLKHEKFCTSERTKSLEYTIDPTDFPIENYEIFYKLNHNVLQMEKRIVCSLENRK
ncbi:DUF870 domain-containing protein [Caenorhabditis elegans]|uniref:Uncharacterized protein n=1 Tax=Caenorhabditis elegans TaxID=6239 RepID=Q20096_CAEEL|nr:Uncharacterized protein CELE_F36A4.1 [Caenorhabditis elegans]CCD69522.1 Uncharacterized protein CELE_F36A4.1 [Caenorhabditis elegans]|eukprot:NP_500529.1 Uncharacterized protein CELE_F36A4.1 [Caenorhabditis elegans]